MVERKVVVDVVVKVVAAVVVLAVVVFGGKWLIDLIAKS